MGKLWKLLEWVTLPVVRQPWFCVAAVLLMAAHPFIYNLMPSHPDKVVRFLLYTTLAAVFLTYFLAWIVVACRGSRCVKGVILGVVWLLFMFDFVCLVAADGELSSVSLALALQTDGSEASNFLEQYFSAGVATAIAVGGILSLALCAVGIFAPTPRSFGRKKGLQVVLAGIVVVAIAFATLLCRCLVPLFTMDNEAEIGNYLVGEGHGVDPKISLNYQVDFGDLLTKTAVAVKVLGNQASDTRGWDRVNRRALESDAECRADTLDVVVVIGESFVPRVSSLYGALIPTNPRLQAEVDSRRMVVFTDMISPANFTSVALKNIFSLNALADEEPWNEHPFFPMIMKRAGYEVSLYDNQSVGYGDSPVDLAMGSALWRPLLRKECYSHTNHRTYAYDGELISAISVSEAPLRMPIYHLMGQHFAPAQRLPATSTCRRWTADSLDFSTRRWLDDRRRQEIADYCNATLYNDSVVVEIFDRYRQRPAVVIYFSDHGTPLYETPNTDLRGMTIPSDIDEGEWLKCNFDVPLMVWYSEEYERRYPWQVATLKAAAAKPGMLDNLGQMVLNLGLVTSEYYKPERDMLSASYKPRERVTAFGQHYDRAVAAHPQLPATSVLKPR